MYLEVKNKKTKYQLYLCHSKRVNGKSIKLVNQYLCSIEKEDLKRRENDRRFEIEGYLWEEVRDKMINNIHKVPKQKRKGLEDEFAIINIFKLFLAKVQKLIDKEN